MINWIMIQAYIRWTIFFEIIPFKMIITITYQMDVDGELMVVIRIEDGGYEGTFWCDRHINFLRAIQLYNPP